MDRARRLFELQIVQEQRTELEAKARRLQLEEQIERSEQVQMPLQAGYMQPPGWPGSWQYPPPGAAYGMGQQVQHQWHPPQQGPMPVWWPMQGPPPVQARPVQLNPGGQYLGGTLQQPVAESLPCTGGQQGLSERVQPEETTRPAQGPESPPR